MGQLVGVAEAARLLGISRAALQRRIRDGELATFEGRVDMAELCRCYPGLLLEKSAELERVSLIRESAFGRRVREAAIPETDLLENQVRKLHTELSLEKHNCNKYHQIVVDLLKKLADWQDSGDRSERQLATALSAWLVERLGSR